MGRSFVMWLTLAVLSACRGCTEDVSQEAGGELVVVAEDGMVDARALVAFGRVPVGASLQRVVTLQNRGRRGLRLTPVEVAAPFSLTVPETLGAGQLVPVDVGFASAGLGAFSAVVQVVSPDAREGQGVVELTLTGEGVENACEVPAELDFGEVALGFEKELPLVLDNPRDEAVEATLSEAASPFRQVAPAAGRVPVSARAQTSVRFGFRPTVTGPILSAVVVKPAPTCPERTLRLRGAGTSDGLRLTPDPTDFGFVAPGATVQRPLVLANHTGRAMTVELAWTPTDFSGPTQVMVPAFESRPLDASFRPSVLGPRRGSVVARASGLTATVQLRGAGGGPDIDVRPARVSFGRVALFPANTPTQRRTVQVWNVGTGASGQREERLFLGDGGAPPVSVEGLDGGSAPAGLTARLAATPPFSPADGLEAGRLAGIEVSLEPTTAGRLEGQLVIFSNDADEPQRRVPLTADVVPLPPCTLRVEPAGQLQFGALTPGVSVVRSVVFENLATRPGDLCLISALELAPDSHPAFALRAGPIAEKELQPGERWRVDVQATSQGGSGAIAGALTWSASTVTPAGRVQLVASLDSACLTVAPTELDVGGVGLGCTSGNRNLVIFNACASPVTVTDITVIDGAGQGPNTPPACAGASPCPEFELTQRPTLPFVVAPGAAPITVSARYRPLGVGADVGALGITSTVSGRSATQVVTLRGEGVSTGVVTDVFQGAGVPRVDILFVIDGSCSMASKQMSLASNLPAFFARSLTSAVDYQLAVIVGQGPPSVPSRGGFRSGPTHPTPILTRALPNAEQQFAARVTSIGASGGNEECLQPALEALTPPLSVGPNAGFLRDGAQLAVVCVTDDSDYSPQPVPFYVAALTNLKQGRLNDLTVSAIAGYSQQCPATLLESGRYAAVTAATGGVREEICTADWAQSLSRLSLTTFGQSGRFFLRGVPDLTAQALEVRVDGVVVSATMSSTVVWRYDALANAVVFEDLFRPPASARVEVTYRPACQ